MADRLYYTDPFLTSFHARVTDIRELSRSAGQSLWQIALDRSAFYPTSGGQPFDQGTLMATSRSGATLEIPIDSVEEDEHGEVWHVTAKPVVAGTEVQAAIDWQRRFDHMQQHSGQHLLSAVFFREFKAQTLSFHLGETTSTIDLDAPQLPASALERVEKRVNDAIAEDHAIRIRSVERVEAEAMLAAGDLRKLPGREGSIRLIEIDGIDLNACGGTHLRSTGQIGGMLLRATEKVRGGTRVEFVCGNRAIAVARRDFETLSRAAAALSSGREEVPAAVERLLADAKASGKERQRYREELAAYHAAQLAVEEMIEDRLRVVRRTFADRDADYIKLLASKLVATVPQTLVLLASTQRDPSALVIARSGDLDFACGALLKEALAEMGLRGGGSADLAQGQVPSAQLDALFDRLTAEVRAGRAPMKPAK